MSKKWLMFFLGCLLIPTIILVYWLQFRKSGSNVLTPFSPPAATPKPLDSFTFEALRTTPAQPSQIMLDGDIFSYVSDGKRITGQIKVPDEATPSGGFPVIIMLRGYVDPAIYQTGMGTKNAAAYFAANGLATLAPDFLGYAGSDAPDADPLAARVHHPLDVINLLASLSTLPFVNTDQIGLWGHSNGGQIALSVLEITGQAYPTVLWAPVSKPFPYSILYYTDDSDDRGKTLRKVIADFETNYNVDRYSIDRYWDWITAPLEIHQGTNDDSVPLKWTDTLVETLTANGIDVTYFTYPDADHNLRPAWNTVVENNVSFFQEHFK